MKFKELKKVLSCRGTFEISYYDGKLRREIYCDDNIDKISNKYSLNDKEVIFITPTDENYLHICLN